MGIPSSTGKASAAADEATAVAKRSVSVKAMRLKRGLTQQQLADLCGMHRNSIMKIENGKTREIAEENAVALSRALRIRTEDLGLHVRRTGPDHVPSIRFRQLSVEQRQLIDELLSLPLEDWSVIREAISDLRVRRSRRKRGKGDR